MVIRKANNDDIKECIALVEIVKDDFAGYKEEEFLKALQICISNEEVYLAYEEEVIGLLLFSHIEKELQFLAVHPMYRKRSIANKLMQEMMKHFKLGETVHVITFRENDPKGVAARACYHRFGFHDDEEIMVFDYPCQTLVYKIS